MSIASEITRLTSAKADIKAAIESKGVTVPAAATLDAYPSYISQIEGGGGVFVDNWVYDDPVEDVPEKDFNYYDFYGQRRYAFDYSEYVDAPPLPNHEGLVGTTWNLDKSRMLSAYDIYGKARCGANYLTTDRNTWLFIETARPHQTVMLSLSHAGTGKFDWGDGSTTTDTTAVYRRHTYSQSGRYIIKVSASNITISYPFPIVYDSTYPWVLDADCAGNDTVLRKAYLCNTGTRSVALQGAATLEYVATPDTVYLLAGAFRSCVQLKCFNTPYTTYGSLIRTFEDCHSLTAVNGNQRWVAVSYIYHNASKLSTYGVAFTPTYISSYAFNACGISSAVIPSTVTTIGTYAFASCPNLHTVRVKRTTPVNINSNVFLSLPSDCVIYVPSAALAAYQAASGWSVYASHMVGE